MPKYVTNIKFNNLIYLNNNKYVIELHILVNFYFYL